MVVNKIRLLLGNLFKLELEDPKCQTPMERHMVVYKKVFGITDCTEERKTKNFDIYWPNLNEF